MQSTVDGRNPLRRSASGPDEPMLKLRQRADEVSPGGLGGGAESDMVETLGHLLAT